VQKKTQQSPSFGVSSVLQFSQVYIIVHTSVVNTSVLLLPHSGQVISDVLEFPLLLYILLLFIASLICGYEEHCVKSKVIQNMDIVFL
tara:strand:+ start:148 stop:411 length:264 start_codon:yes stop_codon:yes gene_type:complete